MRDGWKVEIFFKGEPKSKTRTWIVLTTTPQWGPQPHTLNRPIIFSNCSLSLLGLGHPHLDGLVIRNSDKKAWVGRGEGNTVDTLVMLQSGYLAPPMPVRFYHGIQVILMMGFMFSNSVLTTCPNPLPCNPHFHCSQEVGWCPSRCRKPPGTNISDWLTLNLTSPLNLWTPCDQCRSSEESWECEGRWPPFQSLGQSEGVLLHGVGLPGATFKESYWRWCLKRKEVEAHLRTFAKIYWPERSRAIPTTCPCNSTLWSGAAPVSSVIELLRNCLRPIWCGTEVDWLQRNTSVKIVPFLLLSWKNSSRSYYIIPTSQKMRNCPFSK